MPKRRFVEPSSGGVMAEVSDLGRLLEMAEGAAMAGDLASAEQLLRKAADLQEATLGPLHPDLANTLNNLGIVVEKSGRPAEAETFYRRAVAITSAALPADHPMVAASRENLEAFCRARGVPIDAPVVATSPAKPAPVAEEPTTLAPRRDVTPPVAQQQTLDARAFPSSRAWMAIAAAVLLVAALFIWQPWSSQKSPVPPPTTAPSGPPPASPQASERAQPDRAAPAPVAPPIDTPSPTLPARGDSPAGVSEKPSSLPGGAVTLASAQLCQTFSTSTSPWRCDPAADLVSAGPIVLYTRIRSPRDVEIVHRWYRGDTLRQSVTLRIRASAKEGFRTYSRQTVDSGDWHVEVRSPDGALLHEGHVTVR
jgi:hypothetical protein